MRGKLLLVANVLAANAAALAWAVGFAFPTLLGASADELPEGGILILPLRTSTAWIVFLLALALLGFNVAHFLRRRTPNAARFVLSAGPGGTVRVSRDALEDGLRAAGEGLPEITRLRVAVLSDARTVRVRGQFQCAEGVSNLEASRLLRKALSERFAEMVQLTDGTGVEMEIEFVGFSGRLARKPAGPPPDPEETEFTGPEYPIDDEAPEERGGG